jgi:hypothetical protein
MTSRVTMPRAFTTRIETSTAIFDESGATEIARLLRVVAEAVERGDFTGSLIDANGNRVGAWTDAV